MKIRIALVVGVLFASLLSLAPQQAHAFGGFASAPTSVAQAAISGGIRVTWSAPVDVDTGITGYRVEHSTVGTSGTWTLASTTPSSTTSFDILGLSQVATYVRVAGTTTAGIGAYGYPWEIIYSTSSTRRDSSGNVTYDSGFGLSSLGGQASNTYASANFTRIRYRLDTTISSAARYVETDFYRWPSGGAAGSTASTTAPTLAGIAIPSVNSGQQWLVQADVSDLYVFSDNTSVTKTIGASGRLEIWPWDYSHGPSTLTPAGSNNNYDFGDSQNGGGAYGSFQVHDLTNSRPVFVWNNSSFAYSNHAEIAYGLNSGTHPDWTFCSQGGALGSCPLPNPFRLRISINPAITPLADATPPTVSRIDARTIIKNGDTITVRSNEIGTVYLVRNTVSVTNLASITSAAANVRNSVAISAINSNTVLTTSGLLDGVYNLYAVDSANLLSAALVATVTLDSTAPTLSSLSVNSSGTAILLTASETITNSLQVLGTYTISDSGSALTITATSFIGSVATLNLSRAIPAGASVSFAYAPSGGVAGGRWSDLAGNELAAITTRTITNGSTVPITVSLTVPENISKGISITITSIVSVAGRVTFTLAGKRIPGCLNRVAAGTTPISVSCTFKPALTARQVIRATLTPAIGAFPITLASVERFILKRTTRR